MTNPTAAELHQLVYGAPPKHQLRNCALWALCGNDHDGYAVYGDGYSEEHGEQEVELPLCEQHAITLGLITEAETRHEPTEGGE